ncbi:zf-HC2 domain-containing protein [Terrabacter sp. 2YAF2]|uniref:zf-HC2 domain-containing protein n=1 Tax=Terrabacter sp. 2YAF2 TaxID=3233026 RepID=UPI003F95B1C0
MNPGSDDVHVLLGAYVLGGLSDEDHRTYSEHLRTCGPCQAELGQVSGLPRLLDLAGPEGGPHLAHGPAAAPEALSTEQGDARVTTLLGEVARRRRLRRAWLTALAAAAAVIFFAGGAWLGPSLVATTTPAPAASATPAAAHVAVAAVPGSSVRIDVALVKRGWGTQLDIDCEDMPTNGELALWVIDAKGKATTAASWRATAAGYSRVTGATALSPNEIQTLEVRTGTGKVLASAQT